MEREGTGAAVGDCRRWNWPEFREQWVFLSMWDREKEKLGTASRINLRDEWDPVGHREFSE